MLLPPFRGADLAAYRLREGDDITATLFAPNGFLKVDADYSGKPYEQWSAEDWPRTYAEPDVPEHLRAGHRLRAAAPDLGAPHEPERHGHHARAAADRACPRASRRAPWPATIRDRIEKGADAQPHTASMARMGAACIASAGTGMRRGSAAAMTMFPVVPDRVAYPRTGRDVRGTSGEIGLAGHWIKALLHYLFIYKAKARPLWFLIPE